MAEMLSATNRRASLQRTNDIAGRTAHGVARGLFGPAASCRRSCHRRGGGPLVFSGRPGDAVSSEPLQDDEPHSARTAAHRSRRARDNAHLFVRSGSSRSRRRRGATGAQTVHKLHVADHTTRAQKISVDAFSLRRRSFSKQAKWGTLDLQRGWLVIVHSPEEHS